MYLVYIEHLDEWVWSDEPRLRRYKFDREKLTRHRRKQISKNHSEWSWEECPKFQRKMGLKYNRKGRRADQRFGKHGVFPKHSHSSR